MVPHVSVQIIKKYKNTINKCHCLLLLPPRSTAAIPWRPDERKVSGPTCIRLGQRISLTHNLKCERWVWKYSKGPSTQKITVAPKETITWPPGLAPDPNCTPQICCSSGNTHPPTRNISGHTRAPKYMHNLTAWYQLKIDPGDTIGNMYTLHENKNNGIDPKLCYYVKNLEPATYRCTHTETHNDTHMRFTELMYDLTSYTPNEPKPKTFVWTNRKEGMYCVGECSHSIDNFTNPHNCSWTVKYCFNLTTCGYTKPKKCPELHSIPPGGLIRGNINKTLLHDVNLVMTHVTYNISNILSAYTKHCNTNDESYAQDLFTATRQEILDLRLHKTPRHVLNDLIEVLDLHRWFSSEKMKNVKYSELISTIMMYTGNECIGCIGFFATFPLIHPDQVYPNSTNIRSIGMVVKDQVIKWDHLTGYMTLKGTETVFTSRTCCHETHNYVVCTCNTLQPFSPNDNKLISVESLHGHSNAIQVSHTQWCVISEMNSFTYGGLTCPADHSFCLEVTEDFSMGQIDILGRMPKDAEVSPWWDDTFYEHGTQALIDTMDLVQNVILQTEYHLSQAQVETNLVRKTAQILSSSSTRSAQTAYTWWDWVLRGCAVGSALIFSFTLFQCCYFRHLIRSVKASTNTILTLSPLKLPALQRLK